MSNDKRSLPKNAAKVEFIRIVADVQSMLQAGYNLRNVHEKLTELGRITMSYYTLAAHNRKYLAEQEKKQQAQPAVPIRGNIASASPKKFTRPEDVDVSKLF
jgi:hypothetical protein